MRERETATDEMEARLRARRLPEIEALRSVARWLNGIGLACVALALVVAVLGFVLALKEGRIISGGYGTAGGLLALAFGFVVVAQLTHIRAALKERNKRG